MSEKVDLNRCIDCGIREPHIGFPTCLVCQFFLCFRDTLSEEQSGLEMVKELDKIITQFPDLDKFKRWIFVAGHEILNGLTGGHFRVADAIRLREQARLFNCEDVLDWCLANNVMLGRSFSSLNR